MFEAPPDPARRITLEVADATITQPTDDLTLPVGHDGPITLSGLAAHAIVARGTDHSGEPAIEVAVTPGEWQGDRRLLYPGHAFTDDRRLGHSMSMAVGGPMKLKVADPSGEAPAVTITSALVHVRGPWLLEVDLPEPE